jgi:ABC-type protease/lipase transport system fused ATPase/permease subunit
MLHTPHAPHAPHTPQALDRAMQPSEGSGAPLRTVLVIAHRLSTVRSAHTIVVLDKGKVGVLGGWRAAWRAVWCVVGACVLCWCLRARRHTHARTHTHTRTHTHAGR